MDDLIFQCDSQNSIYVLNSSYKSYGEFARLNLIESIGVQLGAGNVSKRDNWQHTPIERSEITNASTVSQALPQKLRNVGNVNDNGTEISGNAATAWAPVPSTSTSSSCLPAAAIHKLFNCSSVVSNGNSNSLCSNTAGNSNGNSRCSERDHLPALETDYKTCSKKKCSNVKSSLIAKKTKFLQFLEEEKWGANNDSVEQPVPGSCNRPNGAHIRSITSSPTDCQAYSSVKNSSTSDSAMATSLTTRGRLNNYVKHFSVDKLEKNTVTGWQQHQSSNWSGSGDSNNQQQQQHKWQQPNASYDLYKEAAEMLGLSCTLCDNCRCLDCQSSYFDCDDSDNYSEFSSMDDYDDDASTISAMELVMHAKYCDDAVASCCRFQQQPNDRPHSQLPTLSDANCSLTQDNDAPNCNADATSTFANEIVTEGSKKNGEAQIQCTVRANQEAAACFAGSARVRDDRTNVVTVDTYRTALKQMTHHGPLQQQNQTIELENCVSFNELRLTDSKETSECCECARD